MDLLAELSERLTGKPHEPYATIRFQELWGATVIEPTAFEPDPITYRHEYYYNAKTNILYRKVRQSGPAGTAVFWQSTSV